MSIVCTLEDFPVSVAKSAVSIGIFDGVHRGHQALLAGLRKEAKKIGAPATVLTFDRHPLDILASEHAPFLISTLGQKLSMLQEAGADIIVVAKFDETMAGLSPEEFVDNILINKLKAAAVVVGTNFRFGSNRSADVNSLRELGKDRGFEFVGVEPIIEDSAPISSTRIRGAIMHGHVDEAAKLLGYPFTLLGQVVHGQGLGRQLGFPTANLEVSPRQILPWDGVYAVEVSVKGKRFIGVCNIGLRPTLKLDTRTIEIFIDGFEGDIYGEQIAAAFLTRLRDEVRFENLEGLVAQIEKDVSTARDMFPDKL